MIRIAILSIDLCDAEGSLLLVGLFLLDGRWSRNQWQRIKLPISEAIEFYQYHLTEKVNIVLFAHYYDHFL